MESSFQSMRPDASPAQPQDWRRTAQGHPAEEAGGTPDPRARLQEACTPAQASKACPKPAVQGSPAGTIGAARQAPRLTPAPQTIC